MVICYILKPIFNVMENLLNIIASVILAIFFIFFFGRNFTLKQRIKKSIIGHDPFVYITILTFTFIVAVFLINLRCQIPAFTFFAVSFLNYSVVKVMAILLMIFATIICIVSSLTLHNSWRVGIPKDEKTELIRHGIYSRCHNPYFLAYYTFFISMFLFSANTLIGLFMIIGIVPLHILVLKEERHLEALHGDSYRQYKKNVNRYWFF